MTERDWRLLKEDFSMSYKWTKIPRPMRFWAGGKLDDDLLKAVEKAIQRVPRPKTDPEGCHSPGFAAAGCDRCGPNVFRELAQQIQEETEVIGSDQLVVGS